MLVDINRVLIELGQKLQKFLFLDNLAILNTETHLIAIKRAMQRIEIMETKTCIKLLSKGLICTLYKKQKRQKEDALTSETCIKRSNKKFLEINFNSRLNWIYLNRKSSRLCKSNSRLKWGRQNITDIIAVFLSV